MQEPSQTLRNLTEELEAEGFAVLDDGTRVERPLATFRRQLKNTRKSAGLSQAALASKVAEIGGDLQPTAITRIERGDRDVSLEDVLVLAAALSVSPLYLIFPREEGHFTTLTPSGRAYGPGEVRAWMKGDFPLLDSDWNFFETQRPREELVLWSERGLPHSLCIRLAGTVARDILDEEGITNSGESSESRLNEVERNLRQVVDEVESYISRRRRDIGGK